MTTTEADLTASDVAWDLEPLVSGAGVEGVESHLAAATELVGRIEEVRGTVADLDAAGLARVMHEVAELQEHLGRAGSYAGLRFTVDTLDAERGALMQRVEEESTAIGTRAIFFELEWAA
ncbi:MAG: M3 family oligoendopeptidase, partial [Acidimicrobiia bacterium]